MLQPWNAHELSGTNRCTSKQLSFSCSTVRVFSLLPHQPWVCLGRGSHKPNPQSLCLNLNLSLTNLSLTPSQRLCALGRAPFLAGSPCNMRGITRTPGSGPLTVCRSRGKQRTQKQPLNTTAAQRMPLRFLAVFLDGVSTGSRSVRRRFLICATHVLPHRSRKH